MKSIMKKSLAVVMVLSMLLSLALPVFAVNAHTHTGDNTPCDCGAEVKTEVVEATCMEHGGTWNTCTACGDTWVTNETPKLPFDDPASHKLSTEAIAKEATCWAPGHTAAKACTVKGCTYSEGGVEIPQYTHGDPETDPLSSLVIDEKTLTSCLEGGVITYKCQFADVEGSQCPGYNGEHDKFAEPAGHKHELRATGYQAPTCDAKGWVTIDCTVCDDTFKVAIAAKGHNFIYVAGVPAICYEQGYYEGYYCANEWIEWDEEGNGTKKSCSAYYITEQGHVAGSETDPLIPEVDKDKEALAIPATDTHNKVLVWDPEKDAAPVPEYKGELAYQQAMCGVNEQDGWQWWVCAEAGCDWDYKETLEPEHEDDGTFNVVTPPTCTEGGYTTHKCKICREYYEVDPTPIKHTWVSTGTNVVFTFIKDGKTFVKDGDLRALADELNVTIDYIPYMVPAAELNSDATAQKLIADGYTQVAWTIMTEVDCGVQGDYVHKCAKCPAQGFLTIVVDHVWDGDVTDVDSKDDLVHETCTTPGGYMGTCDNCGEEFILSASMVGAHDPDYKGEIAPTGHKSNLGYVITKDPVTGAFLLPVENEVPATCIALGTPKFNYCNNENCSEGLEDYETAKAAVKDTLSMIAHQYYDENGKAYAPVDVNISCMYPAFQIASCKVCGLHYNLDDDVNGGNTVAYEHRIGKDTANDTQKGEADGISHVYPAFGESGRPVVKAPTCAEEGRYDDVQCTLCPYVDNGNAIPVLDPGEVPTYNESMKDGDVIEGVTGEGWLITVTAPTCTQPGKVVASCIDCAANKTDTHETVTIHEFEKTGIHFIKGATYIKNANGTYMTVKGAYVVDRATLANAIASCDSATCAEKHIANEGDCDEKVNDLHAAHYECADCGDVIFFSVRLDHVAGQTECGKPTTCTECEKVLVEAEPHIMAKVDPAETVGDDNDCSTEFYYHIACTECGFGSKSQDFEWTDEWKEIAEYVAAQEHDYNGMTDSTCEKDMECVREGCDHVEKAKKDHIYLADNQVADGNYQQPTCITLGYNIFRCTAGEACDKEGATVVEIGGVKYAEWRVLDASSSYTDHDYDVDNDGVDDIYLDNDGNCLTYNVDVYRCENCYGTATVDEDGFISHGYIVENFKDPTGHEWIEVKLAPTCGTPGYVQNVCKNCFNLSLECVDPEHDAANCPDCKDIRADEMHKTPDFEGKLGYDFETAIVLEPTGHFYWSTPAADATQDEIDNFVAEKIYFEFTCQDAIKHRVPVLDQDGEPTGEYFYPRCAGECGVQLSPDMHNLSEAYYEKEVTCTENGLKWHACMVEGCTYRTILEVVLATGHSAPYWEIETEATCCAPGSAYLACRVCAAAIKAGELVTALTEGETLPEGETFVAYEATADQLTKVLDQLDHDFENGNVLSEEPATIHSKGKKVVQCALFCGVGADGKPVQCPETTTIYDEKLDHVEFSAVIENVVAPDHYVFVNGGKISYTIFIDGENKDLYGLNFNVTYNPYALTYTGFDLGEDNANIFGTIDPSGACNTWVGGTKEGVVSILATASPTEEGEIGYVTVNEKQEFVTLYFDINADTVTDSPFDAGYVTAIEIKNVTLEGISIGGDQSSPEIMFGNDYDHAVVDAEAIIVEKLGDVNVIKDADGNMLLSDKILNVRDVNAIEKLILEKGYDVRADINQDGFVTSADLIAVQRYIINAHSYAEMVGAE